METTSSFLTDDRVIPVAKTTVARASLAGNAIRSKPAPNPISQVASFRNEVSNVCLEAASTVERVLDQLNECPQRIVRTRSGGVAFVFIAGTRYAMLETDEEGTTAALLSDRSTDSEADSWIVDSGGLTSTVQKIRAFLGALHASSP